MIDCVLRSVANPPAAIAIANAMRATAATGAGARHHHDWAWSAKIDATVVSIATASAPGTTMPAGSTAAGDGNGQPGLRLFEWRERHGLGGGNAEDTDADH